MDAPWEQWPKNAVSFITFNYDRSVEAYLSMALQARYHKSEADVADMLSTIPIVHVHGHLGILPWQKYAAERNKVHYGLDNCPLVKTNDPVREYDSTVNPAMIREAAKGIKIIFEDMDETPEFCYARKLIQRAEIIYFLGFGYNRTNMRRLGISADKRQPTAEGTGLGLTPVEATAVFNQYRVAVREVNHDCTKMLRHTIEFVCD